jgi:hypothetical protein
VQQVELTAEGLALFDRLRHVAARHDWQRATGLSAVRRVPARRCAGLPTRSPCADPPPTADAPQEAARRRPRRPPIA